jgi:hypothetical protein
MIRGEDVGRCKLRSVVSMRAQATHESGGSDPHHEIDSYSLGLLFESLPVRDLRILAGTQLRRIPTPSMITFLPRLATLMVRVPVFAAVHVTTVMTFLLTVFLT